MVMRSIGARAAVEISCHRSVGEIQGQGPAHAHSGHDLSTDEQALHEQPLSELKEDPLTHQRTADGRRSDDPPPSPLTGSAGGRRPTLMIASGSTSALVGLLWRRTITSDNAATPHAAPWCRCTAPSSLSAVSARQPPRRNHGATCE